MDRRQFLLAACVAVAGVDVSGQQITSAEMTEAVHTAWVFESRDVLESLTPAMPRADVLQLFSTEEAEHAAWVFEAFQRMETIKPGMTRADLLKVFGMEGGVYTMNLGGRYVFRDSSHFKVHVVFAGLSPATARALCLTVECAADSDVITSISRPFVENMIID
jgi:hypothetical protein